MTGAEGAISSLTVMVCVQDKVEAFSQWSVAVNVNVRSIV